MVVDVLRCLLIDSGVPVAEDCELVSDQNVAAHALGGRRAGVDSRDTPEAFESLGENGNRGSERLGDAGRDRPRG